MGQAFAAGHVIQGKEQAYVVERAIGEGGFGATYLAKRQSDQLAVVLKTMHMHRLNEWKSHELFERECKVLRRLQHPRIPAYVDDFTSGEDGAKAFFLAQQYIEGDDLQRAMNGQSTMEQTQLVDWLCQILEVLDYLHHLQPPVIHRDVTPKNIIVRPDGAAFLVDFGSVQAALRSASEVVSTTAGTFGYAPMEQFVSAAFPSSDLYGLGMTCLAVASGKAPAQMPFRGVRVNVRELVRADARLVLLLERMTEPDPERRLGDARVALEQLRPLRTRASTMSAVVDEHRQKHQVTARVQVSTDDLLPSERLREAATRLDGLSDDDLLQIPRWPSMSSIEGGDVSFDGSLVGFGRALIDVNRMSAVTTQPKGGGCIWTVSANGDRLLTGKDGQSASVFERVDGKYVLRHTLKPQTPINDDDRFRFSPDGKSLARVPENESVIELFDLRTGQQVQRLTMGDSEGTEHARRMMRSNINDISFSADGRWLAAVLDDGIQLFSSDGRKAIINDAKQIAFGADGATVAVFDGDKGLVRCGTLTPHGALQETRKFSYEKKTLHHPRLSQDGKRLAYINYSDDVLIVMDASNGRVLHRLNDPGRPTEKLRRVRALGFTPDGARLVAVADVHFNRFATGGDEDCVVFWSMEDGAHLGSIVLESDVGPFCVAASGHHGPLVDDVRRKRSNDGADRWLLPTAAKALLGEPIDALLDDKARAALADLDTRWAFLEDMRAAGSIDAAAAQLTLLEATQGLTHLLDVVLRDARRAQAEMPSFGGGHKGAPPLTSDQFVSAAKQLAARTKEERRVHFDELLAAASAAEQARAQALPQEQQSSSKASSSKAKQKKQNTQNRQQPSPSPSPVVDGAMETAAASSLPARRRVALALIVGVGVILAATFVASLWYWR